MLRPGAMEQHDWCQNISEMNNMRGEAKERSADQSITESIRPKQDKPSNGFTHPQGTSVQLQGCYIILMSSD